MTHPFDQIKELFEKKNKGIYVVSVTEYKDMVVLLTTENENRTADISSQFYSINSQGKLSNFYPSEDPDGFFEAVEKNSKHYAK